MIIRSEAGNIIIEDVPDFSVEQTLECGQCFHFKKTGTDEYGIAAFGKLLRIRQEGSSVILQDTSIQEFDEIWKEYFDLDRDYSAIKKHLLSDDDKLEPAINSMWGVRILRQDFFETLISFIISQNKQIPHIKQIVSEISRRYGRFLGKIGDEEFYSFPEPEVLKNVTATDYAECRTGFRAPYIEDAVKKVNDGTVSEAFLKAAGNTECLEQLLLIKGVGEKIANCTMLFGLGKTDAFPVDVWIKRIMESMYFGREASKQEIMDFAAEKFGEYGGFAQQYLFYYGRENKIGVAKKEKQGKQGSSTM